jgi:GH15 family glucan-1,4-alpha-glucosidase
VSPVTSHFRSRLFLYSAMTSRSQELNHAAIGNGRVLALVGPTSAIEWLCLPRMDSPSVFGSLLDAQQGGSFSIDGDGGETTGQLEYIANTNVARTLFEDGAGSWEIIDFAPRTLVGDGSVYAPAEIVRLVLPRSGSPRVRVRFDPRPDYGATVAQLELSALGLVANGGPRPIHLLTNAPAASIVAGDAIALTDPLFFVVTMDDDPRQRSVADVLESLDYTVRGWRLWAQSCALPTYAANAVLRSALVLKLHIAESSGAVIAAATTSIPEELGTARTWDYRYCWLRDAAFVVDALRRISHLHETERFIEFLERVMSTGPLQPVYGIGGERNLPERFLTHLSGYRGNGFVRVGNAAAVQLQNDLAGELVLCLGMAIDDPRILPDERDQRFELVCRLVEAAIARKDEPDTGIWELRTQLHFHTFSQAMTWAAIHRGAGLAKRYGRLDLFARWQQLADEKRQDVLQRGFSTEHGCFTQALDGRYADASILLLPTIGLVPPHDARMVSTVAAYERDLVRNGLMLRYAHADDLGVPRSAFTICSFWWAELLALQGRLDDAERVFEHLLSHANPLGLFSEDIDPETGTLLGNFPQAYTHVGLIHAALTISQLRDALEGRARAWD